MKQQSRSQIIKGLTKMCDPGAEEYIRPSEEHGGIICSGEGGLNMNGLPVFDYYQESDYLVRESMDEVEAHKHNKDDTSHKVESSYSSGTLKKIDAWLNERGWYAEWSDPGTMCLVKQ
jgi:hypothetical protein